MTPALSTLAFEFWGLRTAFVALSSPSQTRTDIAKIATSHCQMVLSNILTQFYFYSLMAIPRLVAKEELSENMYSDRKVCFV